MVLTVFACLVLYLIVGVWFIFFAAFGPQMKTIPVSFYDRIRTPGYLIVCIAVLCWPIIVMLLLTLEMIRQGLTDRDDYF